MTDLGTSPGTDREDPAVHRLAGAVGTPADGGVHHVHTVRATCCAHPTRNVEHAALAHRDR